MPPWMHSETMPCGTTAAYRRHIRGGEPPCRPCREAEASRWREQNKLISARRRRRRVAAGASTGWQPGMAADVLGLLDFCEAIEPEWERERAMGADF